MVSEVGYSDNRRNEPEVRTLTGNREKRQSNQRVLPTMPNPILHLPLVQPRQKWACCFQQCVCEIGRLSRSRLLCNGSPHFFFSWCKSKERKGGRQIEREGTASGAHHHHVIYPFPQLPPAPVPPPSPPLLLPFLLWQSQGDQPKDKEHCYLLW